MAKVTLSMLSGACAAQRRLFEELFGESVEVTEALCVEHADKFDWNWAAQNLLKPQAWAEYERAEARAWIEHQRMRAQAQTWAEYEQARAPTYAEYQRARAQAFARLLIEQGD